ncbi:MAG: FAD-dependent pyridine nucleotide-disulfide oxidoreductase [Solirubrobacterales bacterium]|jgi:ferredoxin--NADP+ reductase|nr:FAD-dependent pyridine nucleotide-disulfide oxidoreductase [Solirubrobacterales bacterium]
MTPETPIRIAVIGSGPAGFYAAGHLLKDPSGLIDVDMLERLPTPWGLVRSGVAPDHPKIKSVTRVYEKTAAHPRFRFFGNVTLGEHVSREELLTHYHAIVYATGSPLDRPLGIPGEELHGSHAATEFVGWYNGHPDHTDLEIDLLSAERAVVIGNGNVALDVARMLVLAPKELAPTDTADHALEVLAASRVSEVVIVGRRGPAQAAFTNPELLELGELSEADVVVDPAELERALAIHDADAETDITSRRNVEILRGYAEREPVGHAKRVVLRFLLSPSALLPGEGGRLGAVELVRNELVADADGRLRAKATEERETIDAGLAFRAIGYRGVPLPGVPFDERSGVIPNDGGRVLDPSSGAPLPGEYVVGWIKRGPSGVIGTNKKDAQETVDAILADLDAGKGLLQPESPDAESVEALLRSCQPDLVTYAGWSEIDRHERARGEASGRPRVKLTQIEEMLRIAASESPSEDELAEAKAP